DPRQAQGRLGSLVRPLADPQAAAMLPGIPSSALVRSVSPLEPAISWPPPCGRGWQHLSTAYSLRNYAQAIRGRAEARSIMDVTKPRQARQINGERATEANGPH